MSGMIALAVLSLIAWAEATPQNMVRPMDTASHASPPNHHQSYPGHVPPIFKPATQPNSKETPHPGYTPHPSFVPATHPQQPDFQAQQPQTPATNNVVFDLNKLHVQSVQITWTLQLCNVETKQCAYLNIKRTPKSDYMFYY